VIFASVLGVYAILRRIGRTSRRAASGTHEEPSA